METGNEKSRPLIVVGVPAFNEEKTIAKVVLKAQKYADRVVVCDDGSTDLTLDIAQRMGAEVIRHERNLGYGAALRSLFTRAKEMNGDVLVTLDADGQHDPSEIPNVIEPIVRGDADITVGSRFVDERLSSAIPWYRKAGIKFISSLVGNSTRQGVADAQSGFRAYSNKCFDKFAVVENGMGASVEILIRAKENGLRIVEVATSCSYDVDDVDTSTYNPIKQGVDVTGALVKLMIEGNPLKTLGIPGILCLAVGIVFGIWMLQIYAVAQHIVTNIALASLTFVVIGFFCISLSITLYAIKRLESKLNHK